MFKSLKVNPSMVASVIVAAVILYAGWKLYTRSQQTTSSFAGKRVHA